VLIDPPLLRFPNVVGAEMKQLRVVPAVDCVDEPSFFAVAIALLA